MSECKDAIGISPYKNDIEELIRKEAAYSVINDWLVTHGQKPLSKPLISKHKTVHMGLEKSHMRDPRKYDVIPRDTSIIYGITEVRDMAMQEFAQRLKAAPQLISNAQLIPFLVESLRAENRRPPSDPLDAILTLFSEVTASDEASPGDEAQVREAGGDTEGLSEEFDGPEEDRQDSTGSEELYPSLAERSD